MQYCTVVLFVGRAVGVSKYTGQVHVQFFGKAREHGWVGYKRVMAYKGLAAFEAEAKLNASLRVRPNRLAAWTIAANAAEQAVHLDRQKRMRLLTQAYDPVPRKIASSPKKQKRPYVPKNTKPSTVSKNKSFIDRSAISQDDASPPRKKLRRRSSVAVKEGSGGHPDSWVVSATAECNDGSLPAAAECDDGSLPAAAECNGSLPAAAECDDGSLAAVSSEYQSAAGTSTMGKRCILCWCSHYFAILFLL